MMGKWLNYIRRSLVSKLILTVGLTLLLSICIWSYFSLTYQKEKMMAEIVAGGARLTDSIKLGTHYAMMLNSRDDINQIITNIARQKEIKSIRIYNKEGQIKFSNNASEVDHTTNIKDEACYVCHRTDPPLKTLGMKERTRIVAGPAGYRMLGIISPICNEPGCSTDSCHVHPEGKKILGALDVVVSLAETDREILFLEKSNIGLAVFVFLLTSCIISFFMAHFIIRPVRRLIEGTKKIAEGEYDAQIHVDQHDEMGQLALAVNRMGHKIEEKQIALNRQKNEYQNLFEQVPCIITVQNRDFRILQYNREFSRQFSPQPGDHCYYAYKGRSEKCVNCPVEKTFQDGNSYFGEESVADKDGTYKHWLVQTSPIYDDQGEIVAAMEMSLDITQRKQLEVQLDASERKYYAIFNNIPNPVFVLQPDTLQILDCNESVKAVYGYAKEEIIERSFLSLFKPEEQAQYRAEMAASPVVNHAPHIGKNGKRLFVNIRISPSEYAGQKILLVTTSDITKRLEAEQQLIQAGKMATLGEMATGVAHELNQPLSVIKTASRFFMRKIDKKETVADDISYTMLSKIDSNVDRATKIINHMREFARKSEPDLKKTQVRQILESAFEIFSQQLKVRGVETIWEIQDNLPEIMADPGRMEQVFINLLLNARDAIAEKERIALKERDDEDPLPEKKIFLRIRSKGRKLVVEVEDTGIGIPPSIHDKIFEPFFTTKEVGEGTGLGLSISYGIVKECGGEIRIESTVGEGTVFYLVFPVAE